MEYRESDRVSDDQYNEQGLISTLIRCEQPQEPPFRLLDLPPELWTRICRSAVTLDTSILVKSIPHEEREVVHDGAEANNISATAQSPEDLPNRVSQPAITRVCRTVRMEVLPYYYKANRFVVDIRNVSSLERATRWLRTIGPVNVKHLRNTYVLDFNFAPVRSEDDVWNWKPTMIRAVSLGFHPMPTGLEIHDAWDHPWNDNGYDYMLCKDEIQESKEVEKLLGITWPASQWTYMVYKVVPRAPETLHHSQDVLEKLA